MSYCRMYDRTHEIYMIGSETAIQCLSCRLGSRRCNLGHLHPSTRAYFTSKNFTTRSAAIAHLKKHARAGHRFPQYAIKNLEQEIRERGDAYPDRQRKVSKS